MRRYADMRENGVEKFASPLLIEALELDPPPLLRQHTTPPSDHHPLPPGKYPSPSLFASFMDHFVLYSLCVYVWGGGCHNLILDKLGTQNE